MVRRGALERCGTGANPLETREKENPPTQRITLERRVVTKKNGGAGGNRTHVHTALSRGISKLSCRRFLEYVPSSATSGSNSWLFHLSLVYTAHITSGIPLSGVLDRVGELPKRTSLSIKQRELVYCCQLIWSHPCFTRRGDLGLLPLSKTTCRNLSAPQSSFRARFIIAPSSHIRFSSAPFLHFSFL